jgi:hypothetical protein
MLNVSHFFVRTVSFGFWGQVLRPPAPHSFKKNISHFENHLSFQNLKKIWLGDFQG